MTNTKTILALAVGLAASGVAGQGALIKVDYKNLDNQNVEVNGTPAGGYFKFSQDSGGFQFSLDGTLYKGSFDTVPYTYGLVAGFPTSFQNASVTSPSGNFKIVGAGGTLTGQISFSEIFTQEFPSIPLKFAGLVGSSANLTGLVYSGSGDPLLFALGQAGVGQLNVTFQTLSALGAPGGINEVSSYSGSIIFSSVPEPSTYIAGLGALCLFAFTAIPKRKVS